MKVVYIAEFRFGDILVYTIFRPQQYYRVHCRVHIYRSIGCDVKTMSCTGHSEPVSARLDP